MPIPRTRPNCLVRGQFLMTQPVGSPHPGGAPANPPGEVIRPTIARATAQDPRIEGPTWQDATRRTIPSAVRDWPGSSTERILREVPAGVDNSLFLSACFFNHPRGDLIEGAATTRQSCCQSVLRNFEFCLAGYSNLNWQHPSELPTSARAGRSSPANCQRSL